MKKIFFCLAIICAISVSAAAENCNGEFTTETRISFQDLDYLANELKGRLSFEGSIEENLFGRISLNLRYLNSPLSLALTDSLLLPSELSLSTALGPFELGLAEAYFVYYNFILEGLDLAFGKQRLAWGVSDLSNPTDVLNPLDLSNPLSLGDKIPSISLALTYTIPQTEIYFCLILQPYAGLARLNPLFIQKMEASLKKPPLITGVNPQAGEVKIPAKELTSGNLGLRIGFSLWGFQGALSYVNRISDLPLISSVEVAGGPGNPVTAYKLSYYRENVVGLELAKDWEIFITKAEAALFFQPEQLTETNIAGLPTSYTVAIASDPYLKFSIGLEKDFAFGLYINLQYLHGFDGERGTSGLVRLQDYLSLHLKYSFLNDTLSLSLSGLLNLNNLAELFSSAYPADYFKEHSGFSIQAELEYKPILSLGLKLGCIFFEGQNDSQLAPLKDYDHFYLSATFYF